jgi:hypothetical protein
MAKAATNTVERETLKVVTHDVVVGITLELTVLEAIVLRTVLSNIAGCLDTSPRSYASSIDRALYGAKVPWLRDRGVSGVITFAPSATDNLHALARRYAEEGK